MCYGFQRIKQVHVTTVDSVKEAYRSGVSVSVRNGYGHVFAVQIAKVVKIRGQKEFFALKLCSFGILAYFCTRMNDQPRGCDSFSGLLAQLVRATDS